MRWSMRPWRLCASILRVGTSTLQSQSNNPSPLRDLLIITIAILTWGLGESLFLPFNPIYLAQLGADPVRIGLITGAAGVAMTVAHLPAGYLADRFGRRPVLISGWVIGVIATWIMALATTLPVFVAGMLLYGTTIFIVAPLNSYLTVARGNLSVGRVLTLVSIGYNLGAIAGPWLGGRIAELLGLRQTYAIASWIFLASTALVLLIRPQPVEKPSTAQEADGWLSRRYQLYLGVLFLAAFAMLLPQTLTPNFLREQRGITLEQIGLLFSLNSLGAVALNLGLGQLPARRGFLLSQLAVGLSALILWRATGMPWFALSFLLLSGQRPARSLGTAQIRQLVTPVRLGMAYGLAETVSGLAVILAPVVAGFVYTRNPAWMYALSAGLVSLSLVASRFFSPAPQPAE
jgi:DHA1 family multidrug resistance protein-like MFS transporter